MVLDTVNISEDVAEKIQDRVLDKKTTLLMHAYTAGSLADGTNFSNCWNKENERALKKPLAMNEETRKLIDRDLYLSEHINKPNLFSKLIGNVFSDGIRTINGNIDGINIDYKGEYYYITGDKAKTILSVNDMPILSEISFKNGSKVYYYHINANIL